MVKGSGRAAGTERRTRELLRARLATQWIAAPTAPTATVATAPTAPPAPPAPADSGRAESSARGPAGHAIRAAAAPPIARTVVEVARHLLAVQAQDFGQGVWALGLRSPGATRDDVAAALDSAQVVRSWPMRGTLHFCTPGDLRWMLAVTAPRTVKGAATRHRDLGLDDAAFGRAADIASGELRGGGALSREEFVAALAAGGVDPAGQRAMHIIWRLAHDGLVCWGPTRGTQQALVLLDEWAPATREPGRDEALGEFVLRYLGGHGPATLDDFCWWSKSTVSDARRGFDLVRDRLAEFVSGGTSYWIRADAAPGADTAAAGGAAAEDAAADGVTSRAADAVHALPGFDEYLLGYRDRSHALPPEHADRVVPGGNGMFLPMLVSKGRIVGTWRRAIGAKRVTLTPEFFEPPSASDLRGAERAFARYGRFVGLPATTVEPIAPPAGAAKPARRVPSAVRRPEDD